MCKEWVDEIINAVVYENHRAPRGFWKSENNIKIAASLCETNSEFRERFNRAYKMSHNLGIFGEISSHFTELRKPMGYWQSKENCRLELEEGQYRSLVNLKKGNNNLYIAICTYGFQDLIEHLDRENSNGFWSSKENCRQVLKEGQYKSVADLKNGNKHLYNMIYKYGFQDLIEHLERKSKPNGYYTEDDCMVTVGAYKKLKDLRTYDGSVYQAIINNKWYYMLDNLERVGDKYHYAVYIIKNHTLRQIWIGVSLDVKRRWSTHKNNPETKSYEIANHPDSAFEQITEYVDSTVALDYEEHLQTVYENDEKWKCLSKPGNRRLGAPGNGYYTD